MRTSEEIRAKLKWLLEAVDKEDDEVVQIKLWQQIDFIKWLLNDMELFIQWCKEGNE